MSPLLHQSYTPLFSTIVFYYFFTRTIMILPLPESVEERQQQRAVYIVSNLASLCLLPTRPPVLYYYHYYYHYRTLYYYSYYSLYYYYITRRFMFLNPYSNTSIYSLYSHHLQGIHTYTHARSISRLFYLRIGNGYRLHSRRQRIKHYQSLFIYF